MIKSLSIQNFQSHKHTLLDFSPTVTAIVGLNNHGKSAIFRALQKLIRDVPEGITFVRDGETECKVELTTDNGTVVRSVKTDNSSDANAYVVNGDEFVKFGHTGIPIEVPTVTGCSPIQAFGDIEFDLNFQDQIEPLFLVSGTGLPSIRGKVLSKATGVDRAGRAVQKAGSIEKKLGQDQKKVVDEVLQVVQQLEQFKGLDWLCEQVQTVSSSIEGLNEEELQISTIQQKYTKVLGVVAEAKKQRVRVQELSVDFSPVLESMQNTLQAVKLFDKVTVLKVEIEKAERLSQIEIPAVGGLKIQFSEYQAIQTHYKQLLALASSIEKAELLSSIEMPGVSGLKVQVQELQSIQSSYKKVLDTGTAIETAEWDVEKCDQDLNREFSKLEALKLKLGVCPTCQRPF